MVLWYNKVYSPCCMNIYTIVATYMNIPTTYVPKRQKSKGWLSLVDVCETRKALCNCEVLKFRSR